MNGRSLDSEPILRRTEGEGCPVNWSPYHLPEYKYFCFVCGLSSNNKREAQSCCSGLTAGRNLTEGEIWAKRTGGKKQ